MRFSRLQNLIGERACKALSQAKVLVFGVGGVGGFAVEGIARCGVGEITVMDGDVVCESNINRQIIALSSTVGCSKVDTISRRIKEINPDCKVVAINAYYKGEPIDFSRYDFVVDCIDDVEAKVSIITECARQGVPVITSMGTANHLDPSAFRIADIYDTRECPLAKTVRARVRKNGVEKGKVKALYSVEKRVENEYNDYGRILGSAAFCPSVAGLLIAGEVIKSLAKTGENEQ